MSEPLAYFLSWHTYGTWLHGDERGSIDPRHNVYGEPFAAASDDRARSEHDRLKDPVVRLDAPDRIIVQRTLLEVAEHRGWRPLAMHVRTTHVHVVISAGAKIERVLNDFKSYATRRLREAGRFAADADVWSRHGSTRYLWNEAQVRSKVDYVVNAQGPPIAPPPFVAEEHRKA
ncbi:MAG: transposase [Planctomycetaceae bacterium]